MSFLLGSLGRSGAPFPSAHGGNAGPASGRGPLVPMASCRRRLRRAARTSAAALAALMAALTAPACGGDTGASRASSPSAARNGGAGSAAPVVDLGKLRPPAGLRGSGHVAAEPGRAAAAGARRSPSARARLLDHGPRDRRRVALTFDADMTWQK